MKIDTRMQVVMEPTIQWLLDSSITCEREMVGCKEAGILDRLDGQPQSIMKQYDRGPFSRVYFRGALPTPPTDP